MSVADKARKVVQDLTGMWWPAADEDGLRDAARALRSFADDVDDIQAAANKVARALIEDNKGESIDAFDTFWRRYYDGGRGWLKDLADAARDMAKALDSYADAVHGAKKHLEHELEIVGATLVAGTALAFFTAGISEGAAAASAAGVTELAASLGVAVSEEVAAIAGTTLATAAFGGVESITVDLAVAQPTAIALGEQKTGINLDEARHAGVDGALLGGALGGGGSAVRAARNAGGWTELLGGVRMPSIGPELAMPGGLTAGADDLDGLDAAYRTGQGGGYGAAHQPPPYCKPLDSLGRAQGVDTTITKSMLNSGTKASRRVKPPGWLGETAGHTRGHLLARSLGGDGRAPENIVIMYDRANNEVMEKIEEKIYKTVDAGHDVRYSATPQYSHPSDLIPAGVRIVAKGGGLDIDQTIVNNQ
ncbi:DNA/RNA non-specific endonuclease [Streptomyces sp. NPDC004393]|uniref:DNA/RNA non-specific endonuclease n=1 Tax=Streptomyces sp. NPDC004533 TaxID=3154278 RepID=UPI00339E6F6A